MKLTDSSKRLLFIVLMVAIIGVSLYFFNIMTEENEGLEKTRKELDEKYEDLTIKNSKKNTFLQEKEEFNKQFDTLMSNYNNTVNEENLMIFLKSVEKNTGVWFKEVGYGNISVVYEFGNIRSSNPATAGAKVYQTDNKGISTQITVAYQCTYAQLKELLIYLRENAKKATINTVSFAYSGAADAVTGTMSITFYAINGSERPAEAPGIYDVPVGTENIFQSGSFESGGIDVTYRDKIVSDYDVYFIMNRVGSDMNTFAIGQAGDPSNTSSITSDSEGMENVTIRVTGAAGDYKVSYKIGSKSFPEENYDAGSAIIVGESLDLLIMSKTRLDKNDNSTANLTIINETDMTLNATILNDDKEAPRINIESTQGTVVFHD